MKSDRAQPAPRGRNGSEEEDSGEGLPLPAKPGEGEAYAGRKALLVEADAEARKVVREALARLGFAVDAVESGVAAMSAARLKKPDVILFGLQLRDVPGLELAGWLRSDPTLKLTPMIAISAPSAERDRSHLSVHGIKALLRKPVSAEAIERTVRSVLG